MKENLVVELFISGDERLRCSSCKKMIRNGFGHFSDFRVFHGKSIAPTTLTCSKCFKEKGGMKND